MTGGASTPLYRRLQQLADAEPDALAVSCGPDRWSRRELAQRAADWAHDLAARGVRTGDLVAIVLPNSVEHVAVTFGAWALGATPQPLNPSMAPRELQEVLQLSRPRVAVGVTEQQCPPGTVGLHPGHAPPASSAPLPDAVAPSWKAPTSGGSTGRPKVILAGAPGVWERLVGFSELLRLPDDGGASLVTAPVSHNAPFLVCSLTVLRGGHAVLMPRFDAQEVLRLVQEHRIGWVYAVPAMMARLRRLEPGQREAYDLSSVQVLMHMAAPCAPDLKRFFLDWLGPERVWELYAGTEVQAVTVISGTEWLAHPGSVGRPVSGRMQVRDDDGRPVPPGQVGRIWMLRDEGAPPTYRYLGADAVRDDAGWETLGDLGSCDADGYLYLADRDSDMFVVGGTNTYPAEVEGVLLEHPRVLECCVVGRPHEELGQVPHVVVRPDGVLDPQELVAWAAERLAPHKVPRSVTTTSAALRDDAGKVRRSAVRADLLDQLSVPSLPA